MSAQLFYLVYILSLLIFCHSKLQNEKYYFKKSSTLSLKTWEELVTLRSMFYAAKAMEL